MEGIRRFVRKQPALITFFTLIIGLLVGKYLSFPILLILFASSLVIYLIKRKDIPLLIILALSASIYQSIRIPRKWQPLFFSGIYSENRLIDPVYGELQISLPVPPGNFVYGDAEYIEFGSIKKLIVKRIRGSHPTIINKIFFLGTILDKKIEETIGGDIHKMCSAILLGKRRELPSYMYKRFQYCGAAHLLAVSGLHTGIVFFVVLIFSRVIQLRRKHALIFSGIMVFLYAFLTGLRLPVIRASIMLWFFTVGEIKERNIDSLNTLSASGILILILMPRSIYSISFQLSFLAVFSILIMLKILKNYLSRIPTNWVKKWIVLPSLVTLSAQIGTLPLIAFYFGYIPLLGLIANIILIPLVGALIAGIFLLWVTPFFSGITGSFVWGIGYLMNKIMIFLEEIPFSVITIPEKNPGILFLYLFPVFLLFGMGLLRKKRTVIPIAVPP